MKNEKTKRPRTKLLLPVKSNEEKLEETITPAE
jgi:hypothetical protein